MIRSGILAAVLGLSALAPSPQAKTIKDIMDKMSGRKSEETEVTSGMLYSTGLVAGGSLTGIAIALLAGIAITVEGQEISIIQWIGDTVGVHGWERLGGLADLIGLVMFGVLCAFLIRAARRKLEL